MKKFNLIGGIVLIIICFFVLPGKAVEQFVSSQNQLVFVRVTALPSNCATSEAFRFMKFSYNTKQHSIKIDKITCENTAIGESIKLAHLEKFEDIFVFPGYNNKFDYFSWIALFVLGFYAVISSIISMKK